jgi:hypothetical protein
VEREGCYVTILVRNPVNASFLEQLSRAAGLRISSSKPVLLFADAAYQERRVTVSRGCAIVVYTDEVTDALNSHGEAFGEERIRRCLTSLPKGANAEAICVQLPGRVNEWADGLEKFDDTTILVLPVADLAISPTTTLPSRTCRE